MAIRHYSTSIGDHASILQTASEMAYLAEPISVPFESPTGISREEYAPWGEMRYSEPCLKVKYADGTRVIEWAFEEHGVERSGVSQTLWLRFRDRAFPFTVTLYYRIFTGHDVIERWARLENTGGSGPVTIEQALSADWRPPRRERYRLTYLYGQHVKEMQIAADRIESWEDCVGESARSDQPPVQSVDGAGSRCKRIGGERRGVECSACMERIVEDRC